MDAPEELHINLNPAAEEFIPLAPLSPFTPSLGRRYWADEEEEEAEASVPQEQAFVQQEEDFDSEDQANIDEILVLIGAENPTPEDDSDMYATDSADEDDEEDDDYSDFFYDYTGDEDAYSEEDDEPAGARAENPNRAAPAMQRRVCRFGQNCIYNMRGNCRFSHENVNTPTTRPSMGRPCRWGGACRSYRSGNDRCPFVHVCRFGARCDRIDQCIFAGPGHENELRRG